MINKIIQIMCEILRGYFFQPSRRFTLIQKDDRPSITERNGKWPSGRLLPQLIIFFDLASADFCTGNRADGKSAVSAITGGFNVNTKAKVNFYRKTAVCYQVIKATTIKYSINHKGS